MILGPIFFFYLFAAILTCSALMVVSLRNMVHSVMFLILAFLNAAALFALLGAEFIALLLVVVYVGAIAVLFLFIVMMIDVDAKQLKSKLSKNSLFITLISLTILAEILIVLKVTSFSTYQVTSLFPNPPTANNTQALGEILYTDYALAFQLAGAVLFVAMVGAIALPLRNRERTIRKQDIATQVFRHDSVKLVKVKVGEGISDN